MRRASGDVTGSPNAFCEEPLYVSPKALLLGQPLVLDAGLLPPVDGWEFTTV